MVIIKVDIIGGSLSGLATAITLKKKNSSIDVVVHEKNKEIGFNHEGRRCGEAHTLDPQWINWEPEKKSIFNDIKYVEIYIGQEKLNVERPYNATCILNRQKFISELGKKAEKLGTNIQTSDKIKSIKELEADFIIDASGCPSVVRRELNFKKGLVGYTFQQTLENSNFFNKDLMRLYYTGSLGYYWIFPRTPEKKEINLGVGFIGKPNFNLKEKLEDFKNKYGIKGDVNYTLGGLIPIGLQKPLKYKNILFVGDAGVGAFPLTGEGIYRALLSGELSGRAISQGKANKYPFLVKRAFIKWDVAGKTITFANSVARPINEDLVLKMTKLFSKTYF